MGTIVSVKNVSKTFPVGKTLLGRPDKFVHAVNNVSFDIQEGETFSVVGESGCGKSTTGRLIDHLLIPDSGEIRGLRTRKSARFPRRRCARCARTSR